MSKFQGFESFEVYADEDYVFVSQMSHEFGKNHTVQIPIRLWEQFVKDALNEIEQAAEE